jgi:hypothetical protein
MTCAAPSCQAVSQYSCGLAGWSEPASPSVRCAPLLLSAGMHCTTGGAGDLPRLCPGQYVSEAGRQAGAEPKGWEAGREVKPCFDCNARARSHFGRGRAFFIRESSPAKPSSIRYAHKQLSRSSGFFHLTTKQLDGRSALPNAGRAEQPPPWPGRAREGQQQASKQTRKEGDEEHGRSGVRT